MSTSRLAALSAAALVLGWSAAPAHASTVTFGASAGSLPSYESGDGFTFAPARLVDGNCLDGACLALNTNETTTLTSGGAAFTFDSLSFNLLGKKSALTLTGSNGAMRTFTTGEFGFNTYNTVSLGSLFAGVTSILFDDSGIGNVRIDDVTVSGADVAPIPLPAPALLLLGGIGALAAAGRRRRSA